MALFDIFNSTGRHQKMAEKLWPQVREITALEPEIKKLGDSELKARVTQHRGKSLTELQPHVNEIFAAVREASERVLKMRHFDVQLMGGLVLLSRSIAEMKTGEGKTLVATLPLITHALTGRGAHLVTVNDYLSRRDADWMRPVYEFFDFSVGVVQAGMSPAEKKVAYAADITYGTNNEFGFDYLRDNMATREEDLVQRSLYYAIVDEVDSILIDEARTPLIISAPDAESTSLYQQFSGLIPQLRENEHYNIDEKRRSATLTDEGVNRIEELLGITNLYEERGIRMVHHLEQALRARTLYHKDKDYVVKDGQVIIVDEFTGRMMMGRRYSEGLHQAIEAKEGVTVQQESRTLATITFQNYFRLYKHLAGMTGTAVTSAEEFEQVYNVDVAVLPTNQQLVRQDKTDRIYQTEEAKFGAVVRELTARHAKGQPVLVGTVAIEKSEHLSALLKKEGVPHEVLNAKHHDREAEIIVKAGQRGAVTISTNMAGRGTDIKLGEGVPQVGGLFVLGTERHEARRIDNQLRGRSGRQGDPGETQFFVSLEDDVMRIFGGERMQGLMRRFNLPPDEAIENKLVSRAIESAQERVEGYYFDMRKQVLSYDNVLNKQRDAIYTLRRGVLIERVWHEPGKEAEPLHDHIEKLLEEQATAIVAAHTGEGRADDWDIKEIAEGVHSLAGSGVEATHTQLTTAVAGSIANGEEEARQALTEATAAILRTRFEARAVELGDEILHNLERAATMRAIDTHWMEHLDTMDYLRTGIGLRGYGQRDPLVEYQKEGYLLFQQLLGTIKAAIVEVVFKAQAVRQEQYAGEAVHASTLAPHRLKAPSAEERKRDDSSTVTTQLTNPHKNVGRNDPCWCGSGKKFKKCHGI
jgi:preprotein translocase subunit SecA